MTIVNVKDLQEGDVLAADVYKGESLMLKEGNPLTKRAISMLKQWNISTVEINNNDQDQHCTEDKITNSENFSIPRVLKMKHAFLKVLVDIGHEYRYGVALHEAKDYQWVEHLFIKLMSNATINKLVMNIQQWDKYTYQHSIDVFILASLFAKKLKLNDIERFATGCLLHDVGNLEVPKNILNKPSTLTAAEYDLIKTHTIRGYTILKQHHFSEDIATLAMNHHERANGDGYPKGLKDSEIKTEEKILSIVDIYSALTLNRPYREAYGSPRATRVLMNECKVVNEYYFHRFFHMLDIFPLHTTVELSNGTQAKITNVDDKIPTFPVFADIYASNQIELPLNRSIKVKKIIEFEE